MHKNGHRPDKPANEMTTPRRNSLTVDVSIKDTEVFKDMIAVVHKIIMDDRMPEDLRDDAMMWLYREGVSAGTVVSGFDSCGIPYVQENIVVLCDQAHNGKRMWEYHKHKFNPNVRVKFIGQRSNVDGLRPDRVVLLPGYEKSVYAPMVWLNQNGEHAEIIDLTGDDVW